MITIHESGMDFGPFEDSKVFHIETSALQESIGENIKSVEFILTRNGEAISFIEAKSSSPRPTHDNQDRFQKFIKEISQKFLHSFNLYDSALWGRHEDISDVPERFKVIDRAKVKIKFILVIKGHPIDWLPPLQVALDQALLAHGTIWGSQVVVLNEEQAKRWRLIRNT